MGGAVPALHSDLVQATWLAWGGILGPVGGAALLLGVVAIATPLIWHFSRQLPGRIRVTLVVLRVVVLALIIFLLLNPILVRTVIDRTSSVVAVLYDDSASMTVQNEDGLSRSDQLLAALAADNRGFERALDELYHRVTFAFDDTLRPLSAMDHLRFDKPATDIGGAVLATASESRGLPISAIILFSDGAQAPLEAGTVESLRALDIPVYTVGVGAGTWRDLAVNDVSLSRSFMDDAPAVIGAQLDADGVDGETVVVEVLHHGQVVALEERVITGEDVSQHFRLDVPLAERDWQRFEVRARLKDGDATPEAVAQNNGRPVLYDNRAKVYRVLYFGGRPNWQHKFIQRALEYDSDVQLSSLVRISGAEKKFVFRGRESSLGNPLFDGFEEQGRLPRYDEAVFMRLGLGPEELAGGYPTSAAELYPFDLIVWGDIEPDFFATSQLTLTRDAVSDRGASFLLLDHSEGHLDALADSVLAPLLPTMPRSTVRDIGDVAGRVSPETEAFLSGVWALDGNADAHEAAWAALPPLPDVGAPGPARIGATVLAVSDRATVDGDRSPFLVWQSYGLGNSALLATGETWPWHLQTEATNGSHEKIWRQLIRALVRNVPAPVEMTVEPGSPVVGVDSTLYWTVRDESFDALSGGTFHVVVTDPIGGASTMPAQELLERPGVYRIPLTPGQEGLYRVRLEGSTGDGDTLPTTDSAFLAEPDRREWRDPRFNEPLLRGLASETGGVYVGLDSLAELPAALVKNESQALRRDEYPFWHAPYFYLALVLLMALEWGLRRRAGQP